MCSQITPTHHFEDRFYITRKISALISYDDLIKFIKSCYIKNQLIEDRKHSGLMGPRYYVEIPIGNKKITTIVEKTPDCLTLITVWPE
ncbi:hypothetical protein B6U96_12135 [Archaeoglobales archaeon ex4484_92]|nr:MAG: hypothetical protein B6U96_12135 [Archaeoglobales archaeon ex4484_92]